MHGKANSGNGIEQGTELSLNAWQDLAQKTQEMWLDAAFVVSQRTQRMAQAGVTPNDADHAEMNLMGLEKIEAASESTLAAWQHLGQMQQTLWGAALQQTQAAMAVVSASAGTQAEQHAAQQALQRSLLTPEQLAQASAQMAHAVLHPLHKRASENAERLK